MLVRCCLNIVRLTNEMMIERHANAHPGEFFKVVLVEDDDDLRQSLADYLRLRKMHVTEASSGIEFYKALLSGRHDIAVLDVNLPDTSGYELAAAARASHDIGIVMLTARTGREDRVHGYRVGADIYLTKPVDSEELALAIGNLARRSRIASSGAETQVEWRVNRQRRTLHGPRGETIRLTVRETMLLEHLSHHPGITVPRSDIAALFADREPDPESRRLDAAMARLRAKLRSVGLESPVQIVHGIGLRLIEPLAVVNDLAMNSGAAARTGRP